MRMYDPFKKTAIKRGGKMSKPMQILLRKDLLKGSILDFGCGHGEDVRMFQFNCYNIEGYDKFNINYKDDKLLDNKYTTLTCNYMFNVIPSLKEHKEVLEQIKKLSDDIYISVRSDLKAKKNNWLWDEKGQGFWTSNKSFQRFYDKQMIDILFGEVEYIHNGNDFKLFKLIK